MHIDKKYLIPIGAVLMFCAGFAAADVLLFHGDVTPEPLRFLMGWAVCIGTGLYVCSLFLNRNKM
jgi:hypothetical protein